VMRLVMLVISPLELPVGLVPVEVVAPVVLVDPLVAPIVLEVDELGDVLSVAVERDASVELEISVEGELLGVREELLELGLEVPLYVELVPADVVGSEELELGLVELVL